MSNTEILDLPIKDITVPADRARDFDEDNAQALAALSQQSRNGRAPVMDANAPRSYSTYVNP